MRPFTVTALILAFHLFAFAEDSAVKPAPATAPAKNPAASETKGLRQLEAAEKRLQDACKLDPLCLRHRLQNKNDTSAEDLEAGKARQEQLDKAVDEAD